MIILFKRLAYNSFDSQGAQYNQCFNKTISIIFLVMLALTIPASATKYFAYRLYQMIVLNFIFILAVVWLGLYFSYLTDWPVSFFITVIEALIYGAAIAKDHIANHQK